MLASWADDEIGPTLHAILQTAAHETSTREKLRRVVEGSLMGVSQLGVDEHERLVRSGLIASQTIGFALMRFVWKIEPIASMTDDEAIAAIAPNVQRYVDGQIQ
jgi:Tetracyclin repressor-like, C-terminal domain